MPGAPQPHAVNFANPIGVAVAGAFHDVRSASAFRPASVIRTRATFEHVSSARCEPEPSGKDMIRL
jgi:hypothetical protein